MAAKEKKNRGKLPRKQLNWQKKQPEKRKKLLGKQPKSFRGKKLKRQRGHPSRLLKHKQGRAKERKILKYRSCKCPPPLLLQPLRFS